jgi:hypothetical protein
MRRNGGTVERIVENTGLKIRNGKIKISAELLDFRNH